LAAAVAPRDLLLPLAETRLRKSIRPSQAIPIVHVKCEQNCGVGTNPSLWQAAEPAVGRRTAAASFRGVQLEHCHPMGRAFEGALLGLDDGRPCNPKRDEPARRSLTQTHSLVLPRLISAMRRRHFVTIRPFAGDTSAAKQGPSTITLAGGTWMHRALWLMALAWHSTSSSIRPILSSA
jgi:hypothetical protein